MDARDAACVPSFQIGGAVSLIAAKADVPIYPVDRLIKAASDTGIGNTTE